MPNPLLQELSHHEYLRHKLLSDYPNIDEETLLDTLEGLTELHEMIAAVTRSRLDDLAIVSALRSRISDMQERLSRIEHRADKAKDIVVDVMERAGIKKVSDADFTVSLRQTSPSLVVADEAVIPEEYWRPQAPKLDRQGLIGAIKAGEVVPGTLLGNGGVTISVRTR